MTVSLNLNTQNRTNVNFGNSKAANFAQKQFGLDDKTTQKVDTYGKISAGSLFGAVLGNIIGRKETTVATEEAKSSVKITRGNRKLASVIYAAILTPLAIFGAAEGIKYASNYLKGKSSQPENASENPVKETGEKKTKKPETSEKVEKPATEKPELVEKPAAESIKSPEQTKKAETTAPAEKPVDEKKAEKAEKQETAEAPKQPEAKEKKV